MSITRPVRIVDNGAGHGTLEVEGQDLSGISGYTLTGKVGEITRLALDIPVIYGAEVEGEAVVYIRDKTVRLLIALGWTPPDGTLEALDAGETHVDYPEDATA